MARNDGGSSVGNRLQIVPKSRSSKPEGCKWTEASHAAAKWQFLGERGRGGEIRGSEKGCEDREGKRRKKREGGV